MRAHIDDAFQTKLGANRCGRDPVLACTGFCDDTGFAHAARQNDLTQHIIHLMRASVVQLITLEINLRAAQLFGDAGGEIERAWATDIVFPEIIHLRPEGRIILGLFIFRFQIQDQRHQRFTDKPPAKIAKPAVFVWASHKAVEKIVGHMRLSFASLVPKTCQRRRASAKRERKVPPDKRSLSYARSVSLRRRPKLPVWADHDALHGGTPAILHWSTHR